MLAGCQQAPQQVDSAVWVPASNITIMTLSRSSHYALVHAPNTNTLIFEQEHHEQSRATSRLSWIITYPATSPIGRPIRIDGEEVHGWLLEDVQGDASHMAELHGQFTLHQQTADGVAATLNVWAYTESPGPGDVLRPRVALARRIEGKLYVPPLPQYNELQTESGLPLRGFPEKKPEPKVGAPSY